MLRRSQTNPRVAMSELTRDISRLRNDLNNMRSAVSARGRAFVQDTTDKVTDTTSRAARSTSNFVRRHRGASAGIGLGALALLAGVIYGLMHWRR